MNQLKIVILQWRGCVLLGMIAIMTLVMPGLQSRAVAGLVNGGSDLVTSGTNARFFDPTTPTDVINRYADESLNSVTFIQVGFRTNNVSAFNVTNIAWSRDNVSYTAFTPSDFVNNVAAPPNFHLSSIVSLSSTAGSPFFIRFTLPTGIDPGSVVESGFFANSDGATSGGRLSSAGSNAFVTFTRTHTAVPEPTSIMLALSGAGWIVYRTRRNRRSFASSPA